jgi:two-component system sensor histidine kinase PilS (NtrC family)
MEAPEQSLHRKLVWLTLFRLISVTVLLGGTAAVGWRSEEGLARTAPLYQVIFVTYLCSLAFAILLRTRVARVPIAYAQIVLDVAVSGAVVAISGRVESVFVFMYLLAIVDGAILLYRRGALVALGLALGIHVWVELALAANAAEVHGAVLALHGAAFALTAALASYLADQLRRTDERLQESESDLAAITALHEAIIQSVTSGLVTIDGSGRITFVNRAGEQLTGLALDRIRGGELARWFPAFRTDVARGETDFLTARGDRLRFGYSSFPLVGRASEPLGAALIFQDLTSLRAMEEAVARSERLADLGRVAAGLAHELRNPLAAMMGSVELLRATRAADDDGRLLGIVLREAARLDQLVTEFLAFARPAPLRRVRLDLAAVAAETLEVFEHDPASAAVALERSLASASASVDADRLRQVLWNLLLNARQGIVASGRPSGRIQVATGDGPSGPWLAVRDDGVGIDPADRQRIFLPFFSTRKDGTGLGLATTHRVIEAHGGTIDVESEPAQGACFTVRFPPPSPAGEVPG